ncbi:hypothetical protein RYX36_020952 [Vicia faba]
MCPSLCLTERSKKKAAVVEECLKENKKVKNVNDHKLQFEEDEQLARPVEETLNLESPPKHGNDNDMTVNFGIINASVVVLATYQSLIMSFPRLEITLTIKHAIREATIQNVMSASTSAHPYGNNIIALALQSETNSYIEPVD